MDVELPIKEVTIYARNGMPVAHSDSGGYAVIPRAILELDYLLAIKEGYEPDTIRKYKPIIYMEALGQSLNEVVVHGAPGSQRILRSGTEYVVDYLFVGDEILIASYSGAFGGKAKLFLLNHFGDTAAMLKFPEEPIYLFKSCVGKIYCVCYGKFYGIGIDGNTITLGKPYDIKYLRGLRECEALLDSSQYFKRCIADSFVVRYSYLEKGDSLFHEFLCLKDSEAFIGSHEEDLIHFSHEELLKNLPRYEVGALKQLWDRGSLRRIDLPLFVKEDSLILFDFSTKAIRYFNHIGIEIKTVPMYFAINKNKGAEIIKDEGNETFYLYPHHGDAIKWIQEIDLQRGVLGAKKYRITKPFAENIKVHKGNVYFLWQDFNHARTRQLFVL